jgi:hypothetical protein
MSKQVIFEVVFWVVAYGLVIAAATGAIVLAAHPCACR